jgi:broad specificity phosphatase PhoE
LEVARVDPLLAECDFGSWAGRTLKELAESAPDDVQAWMTDADAAPHGGESLSALLARVRAWLDGQAALDGTAIAVTHGGVISAAVVIALDAPPSAIWRVDVSPLSITELHAHDGRWTVTRMNDQGEREAAA